MTETQTITTLPFTEDDIMRAYKGKPQKCMCGCSGTYFERLLHAPQIHHIFLKVQRNAQLGVQTHYDEIGDQHIYTLVLGKTQYVLYVYREAK